MVASDQSKKGFIVRKPLLAFSPLSYAFFWLFFAGFILFGSFIPTLPFFGIVAALLLVTTIVVWAAGGVSGQTAS